jgi:hypothetical protein
VLLIGVILGTSIGSACGCAGGCCVPAYSAARRGERGPACRSLFLWAQEHSHVRRRALRGALRHGSVNPVSGALLRHDLRRYGCPHFGSRGARQLQLALLLRCGAKAVRTARPHACNILSCVSCCCVKAVGIHLAGCLVLDTCSEACSPVDRDFCADSSILPQVEGRPAARHHPDARLQGALRAEYCSQTRWLSGGLHVYWVSLSHYALAFLPRPSRAQSSHAAT